MKKLICLAVAMCLLPSLALATTYPIYKTSSTTAGGYFKECADNPGSLAPGYEITLPALAQNDSVVVYLPFPKYHSLLPLGTSAPVGGFHVSMDLSAAADSMACIGGIGQRVGGPFNSPFSAGLQVWTRTTTTPAYGVMTATVDKWFPGQLFRVIMKSKGATAIEVGRKVYVRFPRAVPFK